MAVLGKQSKNNLIGVHPNLVKVIETAIVDSPIDFTVTSGVRTLKEQQELYAQGRTKPGSIVTKADGIKNKSNHQVKADGMGHAVDIAPYINGKLDWNNTANFKILSAHVLATAKCLGIKVVWGGNFKSILDLPHYELG